MKAFLISLWVASLAHALPENKDAALRPSLYFNSSLRLRISEIGPGGYTLVGETPAPAPGIKIPGSDLWLVEPKELQIYDSEMQTLARDLEQGQVPAVAFISVSDSQLGSLEGNRYLRYLDLVMVSHLGGPGIGHVSRIPNLEQLHLMGSQVSDQDWAQLAALPRLNTITMQFASIGDDGLAGLARCPALQHLSISTTGKVTIRGLRAVASMPELKSFQVYPLAATRSEIKALKREFPRVEMNLPVPGEGRTGWTTVPLLLQLFLSPLTLIWLFLTFGLGSLFGCALRGFGIRILSTVGAWAWLEQTLIFFVLISRYPRVAERSSIQYPFQWTDWIFEPYALWGGVCLALAGFYLVQDRYDLRRSRRVLLLLIPLTTGTALIAILSLMSVSFSTLVR